MAMRQLHEFYFNRSEELSVLSQSRIGARMNILQTNKEKLASKFVNRLSAVGSKRVHSLLWRSPNDVWMVCKRRQGHVPRLSETRESERAKSNASCQTVDGARIEAAASSFNWRLRSDSASAILKWKAPDNRRVGWWLSSVAWTSDTCSRNL